MVCSALGKLFLPLRLFLLLLLLLSLPLAAVAGRTIGVGPEVYTMIHNFGVQKAARDNQINGIAEGDNGFLWLATNYGLVRYNGYSFDVKDRSVLPELQRNEIHFVSRIGDRRLAIGGDNGFAMEYDVDADTLRSITPPEMERDGYLCVDGIRAFPSGRAYMFACGNVYRRNSANEDFLRLPLDGWKPEFGGFCDVYEDAYNRVWVASLNELRVFDQRGKCVYSTRVDASKCGPKARLLFLGRERLCVSMLDKVFWVFSLSSKSISTPLAVNVPVGGVNDLVLSSSGSGNVWIATEDKGVWVTNSRLDSGSQFRHVRNFGSTVVAPSKVHCIVECSGGDMWLGTPSSGLWQVAEKADDVILNSSDIGFPAVPCVSFLQHDGRNVIVATDENGLWNLDFLGDNVCLDSLCRGYTSLARGLRGEYFASTERCGLLRGSLSSLHSRGAVRLLCTGQLPDSWSAVDVMADGTLYALPKNGLLYEVSPSGSCRSINIGKGLPFSSSDYWLLKVLDGAGGVRWCLTSSTLYRMSAADTFAVLPDVTLQKNHDPCFYNDAACDSLGNVYLASCKGVLFIGKSGREVDSLSWIPAGDYRTLSIDDYGVLWLMGSNGIVRADCSHKSVDYLTISTVDWSQVQFWRRSAVTSPIGNICVGTNRGFFIISPSIFEKKENIGYFNFGSLFINDKRIRTGSNELASGPLRSLKKLVLSYDRTDVHFEVAISGSSVDCRGNIYYRVLPDEQWRHLSSNDLIKINHLSPGDYRLEVKMTKGCDQRSISLPIEVVPAWWQTVWFWTLLAILLFALFLGFAFFRVYQFRNQELKFRQRVDEKTFELNVVISEKDRMIRLLGVDLKAPMFAICSTLEDWLERAPLDTLGRESIGKAYRQSVRLQNVMGNITEWAQTLQNKINRSDFPIVPLDLVNSVVSLFDSQAALRNISIKTDVRVRNQMSADVHALSVLFRNILGSFVSLCPDGGSLLVAAVQRGRMVEVSVSDVSASGEKMDLRRLVDIKPDIDASDLPDSGLDVDVCHKSMLALKCPWGVRPVGSRGVSIWVRIHTNDVPVVDSDNDAEVDDCIDAGVLHDLRLCYIGGNQLLCDNIRSFLCQYAEVSVFNNYDDIFKVDADALPDVILCDRIIDNSDGLEFSVRAKKSDALCHVPILMFSTSYSQADCVEAYASGVMNFIEIPFSKKSLLLRLINIVRVYQTCQNTLMQSSLSPASLPTAAGGPSSLTATPVAADLDSGTPAEAADVINPFLDKYMAIVRSGFRDCSLSIEGIAQQMSLSQSTMARKIKALTGRTPLEILTDYRLNAAFEILSHRDADMQISSVAYDCGFADPAYFSKKFRERFGHTPKETPLDKKG